MPASREQQPHDRLGWHLGYIRDMSSAAHHLSALDTAALVDRVLATIGWDPIDPRSVSRTVTSAGDRVRILLSIEGRPKVSLTVFPLHESLPAQVPDESSSRNGSTDWIAATNGLAWKIWKAGASEAPFREIMASDSAADQTVSAYFSRDSHANQMVDQIWSDETLGAAIAAVLKKHLAGSDELIALLKKDLERDRRISAEPDAIAESLRRLEIRVDRAGNAAEPAPRRIAAASSETASERAISREEGIDAAEPAQESSGKRRLQLTSELKPGEWPEGATHVLKRKGLASFIRYNQKTGKVVILPGSVMRIQTKSSFPSHHKRLREQAVAEGIFVPDGDILRVVAPFPVDTPSAAATLVSGTVSNGWTSWRTPAGNLIRRPPGSAKIARGGASGEDKVSEAPEEDVEGSGTSAAPGANDAAA